MKVATWNVNSVRARQDRLLRWLEIHRPEVVCLQELKVQDEAFPFDAVRQAGYHAAVFGQKTYNGVAILSRSEPTEIERGFEGSDPDPQARFLCARVGALRVASVYVPNGGELGSDKYAYKLEWLRRLRAHLDRRFDKQGAVVLCGDFNVAPEERDVHDPAAWAETVLFSPEAREALARVREWGLVDTFRLHHAEGGLFTWWDYRMLAFPKNHGLRIDHIFASEPLARRCEDVTIVRGERKGKQPSDHAPVVATFAEG
jgi:exodeoxyribonuclease III